MSVDKEKVGRMDRFTYHHPKVVLACSSDGVRDTPPCTLIHIPRVGEVSVLENGGVCPAKMIEANLKS
jgi:hypothetical protein